METPEDISQRHLERCLRLFLSVDIVGSTAFKHRSSQRDGKGPRAVQPWLEVFQGFFKDVPYLLRGRYPAQAEGEPGSPVLWKTLGDEIVFETPLERRADAEIHLRRFREMILEYRETIQKADPRLDVKGTAWLVGFPVCNSVMFLSDGKDEWKDYIGPSMDIGFRLKDFASPGRIAVSVELAYLIASVPESELIVFPIELHLADAHPLKGVIEDKPYPAFWIDCTSGSGDELAKLEKPLRIAVDLDDVLAFCKAFIEKHTPPLFLPFIADDTTFQTLPLDYDYDYQKISEMWETYYADPDQPAVEAEPAQDSAEGIKNAFGIRFRKVTE